MRLRSYGEVERNRSAGYGRNSRLDALQAAALRVKLLRLEDWNERRRELAGRYGRLLAESQLTLPAETPGTRHAWHLYVVRSSARDALQSRLTAAGIGTLIHYPTPPHRQQAYASAQIASEQLAPR